MNEPFETYVIFKNVDESILLLNNLLENYHFEFQKIGLTRLQDEFGELFSFNKEHDKFDEIEYKGEKIKSNFFKTIIKSPFFLTQNIDPDSPIYFIFLKNLIQDDSGITDDIFHLNFKTFGETQTFTNNLLQKLRLFKEGSIDIIGYIVIAKESRHIFMSSLQYIPNIIFSRTYSLITDDLIQAHKMLSEDISVNLLSELAMENFKESYRIVDPRLRFITLMTTLECLFNIGIEQIAHTISRHLSVIVSTDSESFNENYIYIKKLYNIRNKIVHGSPSIKPKQELFDLEDYVRKALKYSLKFDRSKKDLFEHLNQIGF
jgi:hypothetical protein